MESWSSSSTTCRSLVVETAAIVVVVEGAFVVDVLDLVDVVVGSASGSRTTLAKEAKFPSPGVVALSARTVSASEVPAAVFAGGWRTCRWCCGLTR